MTLAQILDVRYAYGIELRLSGFCLILGVGEVRRVWSRGRLSLYSKISNNIFSADLVTSSSNTIIPSIRQSSQN